MSDLEVLVVVDRDDDDCRALKQVMESAASGAKLDTRATVQPGAAYDVCNRIAVEELEAWVLGDESAVRSAFPKVGTFAGKSRFRHPDEIAGGTWEALERLLQSAGYYAGGLPKVDCAAKVAPHIDPTRTRSRSFATFVAGVRALVAVGNASETRGGGEA